MEERFLPIGSVVLLKGGTKEVMITSYCVYPTNKQYKEGKEVGVEKKVYEYGGCTYPEGILFPDSICAFNHNEIEKICFKGYVTPIQEELSKKLNANFETIKDSIK